MKIGDKISYSTLIFGKTDAEKRISTRFLFGQCKTLLCEEFSSRKILDAVILSTDDDFMRLGRKISLSLKESGIKIGSLTLNDDCISFDNFSSLVSYTPTAIICIGSQKMCDLARYASFKFSSPLFFIPTSCVLSYVLSPSVSVIDGKKNLNLKCKTPDYALIDQDIYNLSKKQELIDAFGDTVSKSITLLDYKVASRLKNTPFDITAYELVNHAVHFAVNIRSFDNPAECLVICQIKIAVANYISDIGAYGAEKTTAKLLSIISGASFGECELQAFYRLHKLYFLYLSSPSEEFGLLPDYVKATREIAEFICKPEYETTFLVRKSDLQNRYKIPNDLKNWLISQLKAISSEENRIKYNCYYLYNGRKKLSSFNAQDLKRAIKCASYMDDCSVLSCMCDDGIAEYII